MCGIFACHRCATEPGEFKTTALQLAKTIRHRGPDWSGNVVNKRTILCHERLAVVGLKSGAQPLVSPSGSVFLTVNGEIYNHRKLRHALRRQHAFRTDSDCEIILALYEELDVGSAAVLDGFFAFVLHDIRDGRDRLVAARDPIGITSLYQGFSSADPETVFFASELKSLARVCDRISVFPPGHVYDSETNQTTRFFSPPWLVSGTVPSLPVDYHLLRTTLEAAVRKRLMSEVPFGVLLSGGLDSSLIAAIAARETLRVASAQQSRSSSFSQHPRDGTSIQSDGTSTATDDETASLAVWPRLHSFSIGLVGSPDLVAAQQVANFLDSVHHEFTFTIQEGLDAVHDVIYHLETFDVTTIRASTPMYLLSRRIKAQGVKMVLSGEGSDEIFGGYLYFHKAPSKEEFHQECLDRIANLHLSDCLRANKSTMAWGVEARVPFLDLDFLNLAMNIDPAEKLITKDRMEKYILRKAFDTSADPSLPPYLPNSILWRQKEQFSDGVGYGWIDALKDEAERQVSDEQMNSPKPHWGNDTPDTKEAYWYRCIFDELFPLCCADTVSRWVPKKTWGVPLDPSGRVQAIHSNLLA